MKDEEVLEWCDSSGQLVMCGRRCRDGLAPAAQGIGWMTGEDVWMAKSFKCEMTHP